MCHLEPPCTPQVGADRFLRLWDSVSGACLGERFTGHRMGETVTALGQSLDNTRLVTGDSYGFIKVAFGDRCCRQCWCRFVMWCACST
jgi:hypothetical protein